MGKRKYKELHYKHALLRMEAMLQKRALIACHISLFLLNYFLTPKYGV